MTLDLGWVAPEPPVGMPGTWVRRVYDDRRYVNGQRHLVRADEPLGVRTACGRRLEWVTNARVANRLVPAPPEQARADVATCARCAAAHQ